MKASKVGEVISSNVRTSGTGMNEGKSFTFMWDPVCPMSGVELPGSAPEQKEDASAPDQKHIALSIIFKGLP